jgi:hypothetical protein
MEELRDQWAFLVLEAAAEPRRLLPEDSTQGDRLLLQEAVVEGVTASAPDWQPMEEQTSAPLLLAGRREPAQFTMAAVAAAAAAALLRVPGESCLRQMINAILGVTNPRVWAGTPVRALHSTVPIALPHRYKVELTPAKARSYSSTG